MTWTLRLLDRCSGDLLDTDLETHQKNSGPGFGGDRLSLTATDIAQDSTWDLSEV